ncbi:MAG: hypothetical protein ABI361_04430 [Nitrososphaera sp.]|jgi:hypothetical protein
MKRASRVNGTAARLNIITVTLIDVGSYGALNRGRKGMGKRTAIQEAATTVRIFHRFLILCFRKAVMLDSK